MSCSIYQGYTRDCKDAIGGIKAVYFTELANKSSITEASGVITAFTLTSGKKFWKYELALGDGPLGTADQKPSPTVANGTYFVEQNLTIFIPKHTASISYSIKTLAVNDLMAIVEKNDGTFWLMGENNGMKMLPSNNPWGKALSDLHGFELVFKGMEPDLANQVTSGLMAALQLPA